ncbi:coiled-coil domain-containing protein [Roseimaritima sediminicola]|uniref:DUF4175 family protein n=1 Tax=Roseimaritima sediminicola TaxID=2662066 RepID=UPI0012982D43|nr:DUF4175 family protein [Roseimaritima sediminicola]
MSSPRVFSGSATDATDATAATRLLGRVDAVAGRATRWLRARALLLLLAAAVAVLSIVVAVDWWWRFPPAWGRWMLSAAAVAGLLAALWAWAPALFRTRLPRLTVARRIEERFPLLGDRLSSLVALAEGRSGEKAEGEPREARFIRLAADQLYERSQRLDFADALDRRHLVRAVCLFAGIAVVAAAVVWKRPEVASRGLARLAAPWQPLPWPRSDYLQWTAPSPALAGQPVEVVVQNLATPTRPLPRDLELLWRPRQGAQPVRSIEVDRRTGRAEVAGDWTGEDFQLRVRGGDHRNLPWRSVTVLPPVQLTQAVFRVTPPTATGLPSFEASERRFSVPAGSRINFRGRLERPVRTAALVFQPGGRRIDVLQAPSGQTFEGRWQASEPGAVEVRLQWTDTAGLRDAIETPWQIDIMPDQIPKVRWVETSSTYRVTAAAGLELGFAARDDYRLSASGLLWQADALAAVDRSTPVDQWSFHRLETSATLRRRLSLPVQRLVESGLNNNTGQPRPTPPAGSAAGTHWTVWALAQDTAGQVGASEPLRIEIVSDEQLLAELTEASRQVLQRLQRAAQTQRIAAERTREAAVNSDAGEQQESLAIAQAAQRQTLGEIEGDRSALKLAQQTVQRAETNRVDAPLLDAVAETSEQLARIAEETLHPGIAELQSLGQLDALDETRATQLAERQSDAAERMQALASRLGEELESQLMAESLRDAAARQARLAEASARAGEAADPQFSQALADRQRALAREAERLLQRLQDRAAVGEQEGTPDVAAAALQAAAERMLDQRIASRMRSAADQLQQQRAADAAQQQQSLARELRQIARLQSASSSPAAGRLVDAAEQLAQQQRSTADKIAQTLRREGVDSESAVAQQSDTLAAVDEVQPQLESMPLFPEMLDRAKSRMQSATARLRRSPTDARAFDDAAAAAEMLDEIAAALAQSATPAAEPDGASESPTEPATPAASDPQAAPQPPLPMASLYLVRSVQRRLKDQTAALQRRLAAADETAPDAALRQQQQQLIEQQSELAGRLQDFLQRARPDVSEVPASEESSQ